MKFEYDLRLVLILALNGCAGVQQIAHDQQSGIVTICGKVSDKDGLQTKANKTCSSPANVQSCSLSDSKNILFSLFSIESIVIAMYETCCVFKC